MHSRHRQATDRQNVDGRRKMSEAGRPGRLRASRSTPYTGPTSVRTQF